MLRKCLMALAAIGSLGAAALGATPASAQYGPDTCRNGFVWREAFPGDHVCVRPWVRAQASRDNYRTSDRYRYR
jgi:hypothetical protein